MRKDIRIGDRTYRVTVRWGWLAAGLAAVSVGLWAILGPGIDVEMLEEQAAIQDCAVVIGANASEDCETSLETLRTALVWTVRHLDAQGSVLWEQESAGLSMTASRDALAWLAPREAHAAVIDEGEQSMLACFLRGSCPTTYYLRLYNDTCAETKTLATLAGEPSTNGYAAQQITRDTTGWPTLALNAGDYQATSSTKTFSASGGSWGPVTAAVLATTSDGTGVPLNCLALSQSRTLASDERLQVTVNWKQQ